LRIPVVKTNGEGIPIIACDIDGTLGDYHSHFLDFARKFMGKEMPPADQINPGQPLWKFMGVTQEAYRECKLAFRQGGNKRWMPMYPGIKRFADNVKTVGAELWLCTTRPYLRLDNIDPDTRECLRRAGIEPDGLLFGDDKYKELHRQAGSRVAGVIDDLPEMCLEANKYFPLVAIRDQPYNQHTTGFMRVKDASHMWLFAAESILTWRFENGQAG